jgi:hypothetical protein
MMWDSEARDEKRTLATQILTSAAKTAIQNKTVIAALKALRHPKSIG